jgi:hypothetical protein
VHCWWKFMWRALIGSKRSQSLAVYMLLLSTPDALNLEHRDFHSFHCPYLIVLCKSEYGGQHCGQLERLALVVMARQWARSWPSRRARGGICFDFWLARSLWRAMVVNAA